MSFFCLCPVYQRKENPLFCRWIPPPSAQLSVCAHQARCIRVFHSLLPISMLWVLLVWKSSPLCPSLLPRRWQSRAGLPSRSPARALLSPGYLRCAGTDLSTACCHLPPLPCHAVAPLDLKMIKLFSCGAYSANTPICIMQAKCHCIFSLCFCTSLFQPIYFLWDFHLFPTSDLK